MVSRLKGKTCVLVEYFRKEGRNSHSRRNVDAEFEKEANAWAEAKVDAPEREGSGSEGLQRECTREELKGAAKLGSRKAAGADRIVN